MIVDVPRLNNGYNLTLQDPTIFVNSIFDVLETTKDKRQSLEATLDGSVIMHIPAFMEGHDLIGGYHIPYPSDVLAFLENRDYDDHSQTQVRILMGLETEHYANMGLLTEVTNSGISNVVLHHMKAQEHRVNDFLANLKKTHQSSQRAKLHIVKHYETTKQPSLEHGTLMNIPTLKRTYIKTMPDSVSKARWELRLQIMQDYVNNQIRAMSNANRELSRHQDIIPIQTMYRDVYHGLLAPVSEAYHIQFMNKRKRFEEANILYPLHIGKDDQILAHAMLVSILQGTSIKVITADRDFTETIDILNTHKRMKPIMGVFRKFDKSKSGPCIFFEIDIYQYSLKREQFYNGYSLYCDRNGYELSQN